MSQSGIKIYHDASDIYINSYFLLIASAINMVGGSLFLFILARSYTEVEVGYGSAIISIINLVSSISLVGLEIGIIKYIHEVKNKSLLINSCFSIIILISIVLSLMLFSFVGIIIPDLTFLETNNGLDILITLTIIFSSLSLFQKNILIALKCGFRLVLITILSSGLKIILLILLVAYGVSGIIISWSLPQIIYVLLSLTIIRFYLKDYLIGLSLDTGIINTMWRFSIVNYLAENIYILPRNIYPILILSILGPEEVAFFYIAWSIAQVFFTISWQIGLSLYAEGSSSKGDLRSINFKSIKLTLLILVLMISAMFLVDDYILSFFGKAYLENSLIFLKILVVSSIPVSFVEFYIVNKRIAHDLWDILYCYSFITIFSIVIGYLFIDTWGINSIAVGWFIAHLIASVFILFRYNKTLGCS